MADAIEARQTPHDASLRRIWRRAVAEFKRAVRAQRRARAGAGAADIALAVARIVTITTGAATVHYTTSGAAQARQIRRQIAAADFAFLGVAFNPRGAELASIGRGYRLQRARGRKSILTSGLSGRGAVHPQARAWTVATDARGRAMATARAASAELARRAAQRAADFTAGTRGLRAGWLR
ncbi:hypothetical protein CCP3SC15_1390016 [Gammaproteobacteria bacterium]